MYLSADAIAAMEGIRRVHSLNPAAIRIDKSLGDEVALKNIGIHLISIAPGDKSTEFHSHKFEEEAIYVLSGRGAEVMGETRQKIGPGDFVGFPGGGVAHETINDGPEPLVCLVIGQRLAQD
ncbi:MAG: cupin domain-containing protein, partial [Candidatus Binatia bacterium]